MKWLFYSKTKTFKRNLNYNPFLTDFSDIPKSSVFFNTNQTNQL